MIILELRIIKISQLLVNFTFMELNKFYLHKICISQYYEDRQFLIKSLLRKYQKICKLIKLNYSISLHFLYIFSETSCIGEHRYRSRETARGMKSLTVTDATAARKTRKAKVPCIMRGKGKKRANIQPHRYRWDCNYCCMELGGGGVLRVLFACKLAPVVVTDLFSPALHLFLPSPDHENNRSVLVSMSGSRGKLMKLGLDCERHRIILFYGIQDIALYGNKFSWP